MWKSSRNAIDNGHIYGMLRKPYMPAAAKLGYGEYFL